MIAQFTYTASPWGKTGAGWMVFQQSRGVPPEAPKALYPVYNFSGSAPADGAVPPVQFAYLPAESGGGAVLAQTTFTGTRWFDPRPGDFFAHVLMLDEEAVEKSAAAGANPAALFRGGGLQAAFPEKLKEKALRIYRKTVAWEPPPVLPAANALSDFAGNPELTFGPALDSLPENAVRKLGAILAAMLVRSAGKGAEAVVFDGRNPVAVALISLVLDLFPPSRRARTWFAVGYRESALRRLYAFPSLACYTVETVANSDSDTGIAAGVDFSRDPFRFASREDVKRFRHFLGLMGPNVPMGDFKALVSYREVLSGRTADLERIRVAKSLADRFPKLREPFESGLARMFADGGGGVFSGKKSENTALVAWFEFGLFPFKRRAEEICVSCARDATRLFSALEALEETFHEDFLESVSSVAAACGATADLSRIVRDAEEPLKGMLRNGGTGLGFSKIAAATVRFAEIRRQVESGAVPFGNADGLLAETVSLEETLGGAFDGMASLRTGLERRAARDALSSVSGIGTFVGLMRKTGAFDEDIRAAVLERVPPASLDAETLALSLEDYGAAGLSREEVLRQAFSAIRAQGERAAESNGKLAREAAERAAIAEKRLARIRMAACAALAVSLAVNVMLSVLLFVRSGTDDGLGQLPESASVSRDPAENPETGFPETAGDQEPPTETVENGAATSMEDGGVGDVKQ